MVSRKTIVAVSYLNTIPFIYGISHGEENLRADLLLAHPSKCSSLFIDQKCDIALVPVAAALGMKDVRILEKFCIGASGSVRSVVLFSNSPLEKISKIYLDPHSQTSVLLARVLADGLWNINPSWLPIDNFAEIDPSDEQSAWVLIGDKVFDYEDKFEYKYDLAEHWQQLTGLPFTFAVWVAREDVSSSYIDSFERALEHGVNNIASAIESSKYSNKSYALEYLTHNIDYIFDDQKKKAMELFWKKGIGIGALINPG